MIILNILLGSILSCSLMIGISIHLNLFDFTQFYIIALIVSIFSYIGYIQYRHIKDIKRNLMLFFLSTHSKKLDLSMDLNDLIVYFSNFIVLRDLIYFKKTKKRLFIIDWNYSPKMGYYNLYVDRIILKLFKQNNFNLKIKLTLEEQGFINFVNQLNIEPSKLNTIFKNQKKDLTFDEINTEALITFFLDK